MKLIIIAILITFVNIFLVSSSKAQENGVKTIESIIIEYEDIRSELLDSLDVINNKIDSLNNKIIQKRFESQDNAESKKFEINSDARIYEAKSVNSNIIGSLKIGDEVAVINVDGTHFVEIIHRGIRGYIMKRHFKDQFAIDDILRSYRHEELKHEQYIDSLIGDIERNKRWVATITANIRNIASTNSEVIDQMEKGDVVFVQEINNNWYKIYYFENPHMKRRIESEDDISQRYKSGWIHNSIVAEDYVEPLTRDDIRRNSFVSNNPDLRDELRRNILNGKVSIGMSREMVRASWGEPREVNRTVTSNSVNEQWVYGTIYNRQYLYFRNGIMHTFQD